MLWVARRSGGLKAGAERATASGGFGLDPARSPVLRTTMRSVEDRARKRVLAQLTAERFGFHFCRRASIVLRMMISLRMQATSATFGSFPFASRR